VRSTTTISMRTRAASSATTTISHVPRRAPLLHSNKERNSNPIAGVVCWLFWLELDVGS
jgi:hypothetical protein